MKKRFTEEQIVRILQEAEAEMLAKDVCRKHNVSEQTLDIRMLKDVNAKKW